MNIKNEPVLAGDVVKVAVWLVTMLVVLGALTTEEAEQVREAVVLLAPGLAVVIQMGIAYVQRKGVTPWRPENVLVNYEPSAASVQDEAAE